MLKTLQRILKERLLNKRVFLLLSLILVAFSFFKFVYPELESKFIITQDVSLDQRFWFITPYEGKEVKKGDYIEFKIFFNYKKWNKDKDLFLKEVVCVPGDKLVVKDMKVYCNDKYLGTIQKTNSEGEPVSHFEYTGIIPESKYFVMGTHVMSYDSRYFGFVDKQYIVKRAYPIWF